MIPFGWLAIALASTAFAQLAFKRYFKARRMRWLVLSISLFVLIPYTTFKALEELPLSTVYISTAASQLLVVLVSLVTMGERYSKKQYAGLALILAGVLLFNI